MLRTGTVEFFVISDWSSPLGVFVELGVFVAVPCWTSGYRYTAVRGRTRSAYLTNRQRAAPTQRLRRQRRPATGSACVA